MKYVEIKDNVVVVSPQEQPAMPDLSGIGRICVDVTNLDPQPQEGWAYDSVAGTFTAPVPVPLTTEQKISIIRNKYDIEVQKACKEHLFNSISSTRTISKLTGSILKPIALKITAWELEQQNKFVTILASVKAGTKDIDTVVFDDEWVTFKTFSKKSK